ncbi:response regulator, partial [Rheinheimera baltica]
MPTEQLILIVEDEPKIAQILVDFFQLEGFNTAVLHDGRDAVKQVQALNPAAVILDVMLPHKDGLTICREVREFSQVPILMLTARVDEIDRLSGLGFGADDYICKPFFPREVVARVKATLKRNQVQQQSNSKLISYKNLQLDTDKFRCLLEQQEIEL